MTQQGMEMKKKGARTIFGAGTKSIEKYNAGHGKRSRTKQNFFLITNKKLFQKRRLKSRVTRITALQKLNQEIF